uniref:Ion transport peptide isoform A n=1 Tax=Tribolium castaneum TaxID=7070 RepID=A3RE85_TRICA|nr:PREDICTED: ion transport peptide isoform X1 [Tribolium castaneum]XP_008195067.1 PREDICTED: ion transport peptide isoform X1 [Tribolium castaneum]XP_008195068.1 PREDICTED: ion transport peptide isoform X1 [Tribolium castaneum]XP_008195069.1 PREDICTED: ion transport peptide isoform X1 [Tribolium castaneum]ABN79657.1 ion transport peptide isoform A [Tribolium castaneum]|eukprot:XP_008195066.1 PREDICTED: ion transport peptide isoform X1 [Tribolium castaneum]
MNYRSSKSISTQAVWVCMVLAVVFQEITSSPAGRSPAFLPHHFTKRSFFDIQCKGVYDKSIFAKLDSICEDCYMLFREPQLHNLCRKNCFTTDYFKGCIDTLQRSDEEAQIQLWIKQIRGAELGGLGTLIAPFLFSNTLT